MTHLADIIDTWAREQPKQFVIVYGPGRVPPWIDPKTTMNEQHSICCQWCGKWIANIYEKYISVWKLGGDYRIEAIDREFFPKLRETIRSAHNCVADRHVS